MWLLHLILLEELTTDEGVAQSFTIYVKEAEIEELNKAINYGEIHIYQK